MINKKIDIRYAKLDYDIGDEVYATDFGEFKIIGTITSIRKCNNGIIEYGVNNNGPYFSEDLKLKIKMINKQIDKLRFEPMNRKEAIAFILNPINRLAVIYLTIKKILGR